MVVECVSSSFDTGMLADDENLFGPPRIDSQRAPEGILLYCTRNEQHTIEVYCIWISVIFKCPLLFFHR